MRLRAQSPLAGVAPSRVTREGWLEHGGNTPAAAASLQVHAQTVRYRMKQVEALFGTALHDRRDRRRQDARPRDR
ncbi:helix-turn-helix domain-containing protein [Streptomyces sp. NPDC051907]|uniref:helix-turn-helix domain-containing protein n=1 Tax=Streptomyces sp. NPDC051907 TaxID=3155284 RepID=UPI00341C601D